MLLKMTANDLDLLGQYARRNSQEAFAEIVRRHLDLVYSAALRQIRSPQLAEEIAQSVFNDLARNAGKMKPGTVVTAWLYAVTRRTAIDAIRKESRRQLREQIALEMSNMNATANDWMQIAPQLDDAMAALDEGDRAAILLRFFENKGLREVGEQLKISDDAAQKRVSRAIERLREFFSKRNVTIGAGGVAVLISANAVQSAPAGLSTAILTATSGITATLGMTMIHKILIGGLAAAAIGGGIYSVHVQRQIGALEQQQMSLNRQIAESSQELDEATNQLAAAREENQQLHANDNELLKLRAEVTQLRQQSALPEMTQSETKRPPRRETLGVRVGTKFVLFPAADLQSLGIEWTPGANGDRFGLLTEGQFKLINEAIAGASDVTLLEEPTILNGNGGTCVVGVYKQHVDVGSTNADIGLDLGVTTYYSTNSSTFDLSLFWKAHGLGGDPTRPEVQVTSTNQFSLTRGQIAVLGKDIPDDSWMPGFFTNNPPGPKSLLVFVTPTVIDLRDYERPGNSPGTVERVAAIFKSQGSSNAPNLPGSP